jgi:hypothetical protein
MAYEEGVDDQGTLWVVEGMLMGITSGRKPDQGTHGIARINQDESGRGMDLEPVMEL